ncbi:MAG: Xaa-Pro peptidase family protein [Candidatus Auribacterota bacterium]|nr:Xaa-Pro peptidase family protein [Candidatus Auribacterota bacterium]
MPLEKTTMIFDYQTRLNKLRRSVSRRRLDGLLISCRENIYYLSGFTGDDSRLLVTSARAILITDFRFRQQAEETLAPGCELRIRTSKSLNNESAAVCRDLSLKKIGFEESHLSYDDFTHLKKYLRGRELRPAGSPVESLRMIKDPEEISLLRESARLSVRVLERAVGGIRFGMTEADLSGRIIISSLKTGGTPAFSPIVAAGDKSSRPHAVPGPRSLNSGMILLVDMGVGAKAYMSDMTRTFVLEEYPRRFKTIYRAVLGAQETAIRFIRPGVKAAEVDGEARRYLEEKGYGRYFGHSLGHGVGLEVHERPVISSRSRDVIKEGMVFTVEPGVYIPGWGGIRIEDTVLVTKDGCEILTEYPKALDLMMIRNLQR